jgi:N-acyl-D-aspartate/D-glutamate deacylase
MVRVVGIAALFLLAACATATSPAPGGPVETAAQTPRIEYDYDILIRGGTIYDGSGGKPFVADIGVKDGQINAVYPKLKGDGVVEINARGKAVAPGFFDLGGAGDLARGVTTAAACNAPTAVTDEPLSAAVLHRTSEPAARLGLKERGRLMPGWAADVVVFEPKGAQLGLSEMDDVIVAGILVIQNGGLAGSGRAPTIVPCP